jgi:protein subunit release factor A
MYSEIEVFCSQDNRVTDHRLKMNFELTSFLFGDIESAVQVHYLRKKNYINAATRNY